MIASPSSVIAPSAEKPEDQPENQEEYDCLEYQKWDDEKKHTAEYARKRDF
jgi:hypothetical protein